MITVTMLKNVDPSSKLRTTVLLLKGLCTDIALGVMNFMGSLALHR